MAVGKEIRGKIKSIENTKKITKAMEMVAASKMRKAQERMRAARPYSEKVRTIASNLARANPEYTHPFLVEQNASKKVGFIVVTTDKGLCGALNTNLLRSMVNLSKQLALDGIEAEVVAIGNKGYSFLNRSGYRIIAHKTQLGDTPHLESLIGPIKVMLDAYQAGELDAIYLCYTRFLNTMKQEATLEKLLPLSPDKLKKNETGYSWDYIYEPDAKTVIDELLLRYVEALIYQAVAENMASEQSARMVAMKAASDNAGTLIGELKLIYNKTRQAAITKELSEIVAGAQAV